MDMVGARKLHESHKANLPNYMREQQFRSRNPARSFNKCYTLIIGSIIDFNSCIVCPGDEATSPLHRMNWTFTRVQNLPNKSTIGIIKRLPRSFQVFQ